MATSSDIIREVEAMEVKGAFLNAVRALEALELLATESQDLPAPGLVRTLDAAADRLSGANTSWAVVSTACEFATDGLHDLAKRGDLGEVVEALSVRARVFLDRMRRAQEEVGRVGARLVPDDATVLLMSYSGTLIEILKRASELGRRFSVIGTESRPKGEGRTMAKAVVGLGIPCTLITDPAQPNFVRRGDIALVGVDTLMASSAIVNKVGTMNLALACRYYGVPLYAASSTFKMSLPSLEGARAPLKIVEDKWGIGPEDL